MSDTVIIVLIVAVVILVALVIFRKQLSQFFFKATKDGIEAKLETHKPDAPARTAASQSAAAAAGERAGVTISGNKQIGKKQKIDVGRPDVAVTDNLQLGEGQEVKVRPDETSSKPKS